MNIDGHKLIDKGIKAMNQGTFKEAESAFNAVIENELESCYGRAYYHLGVLFDQHLNNYDDALICYKEATEIEPDHPKAWNNYGHTLLHFDRYQEAEQAFKTAVKITPEATSPLFNLAYTFNRLNKFTEAIPILQSLPIKGTLADEIIAKLHSELGLALLQTQEVYKAYDHFMLAYKMNNQDYQTCYNIAFIADVLKDFDEAIEFYDKAIACRPAEAKAYQGKACTYIHTEQFENGLPLIQKAISLSPHNFEGYYNLACIYAGLDQEENLLDAIKQTISLAPPQIGIANHLKNDPDFSKFANSPAFRSILESM